MVYILEPYKVIPKRNYLGAYKFRAQGEDGLGFHGFEVRKDVRRDSNNSSARQQSLDMKPRSATLRV